MTDDTVVLCSEVVHECRKLSKNIDDIERKIQAQKQPKDDSEAEQLQEFAFFCFLPIFSLLRACGSIIVFNLQFIGGEC